MVGCNVRTARRHNHVFLNRVEPDARSRPRPLYSLQSTNMRPAPRNTMECLKRQALSITVLRRATAMSRSPIRDCMFTTVPCTPGHATNRPIVSASRVLEVAYSCYHTCRENSEVSRVHQRDAPDSALSGWRGVRLRFGSLSIVKSQLELRRHRPGVRCRCVPSMRSPISFGFLRTQRTSRA